MAMMNSDQLRRLGFRSVGRDCAVSDRASIYGVDRISLGDHVRIDDFAVLSAGREGITIGSFVHVASGVSLTGAAHIRLDDFSGLSARVAIFSSSDDYSGLGMTNPTVPEEFTKVRSAAVHLGRHVIIGAGSVILPGSVLEEGVAVGALSLVSGHCPAFGIYAGVPAKRVRERRQALLDLERQLREKFPLDGPGSDSPAP